MTSFDNPDFASHVQYSLRVFVALLFGSIVGLERQRRHTGRPDSRLEQIVSKIGLEAGVFAVSWKSVPTSDEDRELMPDA